MNDRKKTILLVEGETEAATSRAGDLGKTGYAVLRTPTGRGAIDAVRSGAHEIDLILMDLDPGPGMDGAGAAREILRDHDIPVVFLSSGEEKDISARIEDIAAFGCVPVTAGIASLSASIVMALNMHAARRSLREKAESLREGEEHFRGIFEKGTLAMALVGPDYYFIDVNPVFCVMMGYSVKELAACTFKNITHPDYIASDTESMSRLVRGEIPLYQTRKRYVRKDGAHVWGHVTVSAIRGRQGELLRFLVMIEDITERMHAEQALKNSREIFHKSFQSSPASLFIVRLGDARIVEVNRVFEKVTGHARAEVIGRSALKLGLWADTENRGYIWQRLITEGTVDSLESRFLDKAGSVRVGSYSSVLIDLGGEPCFLITLLDVTDRKLAEESLKQSLQEKEILMKEIQHRVKNNLNTITSLLGLEMDRLPDNRSRQIFIDTQLRIRSMAAIYERLNRSSGIESVELDQYIGDLANSIFQTMAADNGVLTLATRLEGMRMDVQHAVPLGIIVNELMTNALKYAYSAGTPGEIRVELESREGLISLRISDDGAGMPEGMDPDKADTMGLRLVRMLARQVNGKARMESAAGKGVSVTVEFSP